MSPADAAALREAADKLRKAADKLDAFIASLPPVPARTTRNGGRP